ncbi:hypothetical protein GCM10023149_29550 [Mucilaginibacter gynuensis]|uniref:Histidine kinase domain-containing protein n=2 Tax=Mucilaginibacter gynuensis TaxID=1302236 RepID=A0ABP8GLL2_9SPHI
MLPLNSEVVSISEDKNNRLWLAGRETGVTVLEPESGKFTAYRHSENNGALASDHVNTLVTDRSGIIWIGTNNGLSIYDPVYSPFQKFYLPANANGKTVEINDFYRDDHEDLWIAANNGIYIREHKTGQFKFRRTSYRGVPLAVTKFFNGKDGVFYIGTDQSIFKYDRQRDKLSRLSDSTHDPIMKKPSSSRITSIISDSVDHHPVLIVSSNGTGLTYYDLLKQKWVLRPDHLKGNTDDFDVIENAVKKLYRDQAGSIWIATEHHGLGKWQQTGQPIKYIDGRSDNRSFTASKTIYDIKEDGAGNLWISTYGGGLHHFDTKHFSFDHINGSNNLTEGLQTDRHGNVWMVSNGHLHAYSPLNKVYSCYDLPEVKDDGGIKGYIYRDNNGILYAGGTNYYVTFDPAAVSKIASQPNLYFTDFKIFNKSYGQLLNHSEIKLIHTQNYFSIEFAAPEYNSNHVQFAYMLDGFDNEWIVADRQNFASYSNLPPGKYVFKVKASNWEGNKTDKIKTLTITIEPPFYRRWYFFVAAGILITGLLYLVYRYRINEYLKRQSIRNMIAQDLHDQIGSTLSSIAVYSKVAKVYQLQKEPEKLTEVLTIIGCTASETIVEMADIVWAINPKNDQVSSIIQKIQSYARPLCAAQNIEFTFSCDAKIHKLTLEMSARKNFYLIIKEAITNAIKHSDCSQLNVDIRLHHYVIEMLIEDNGTGFDTSSDTRSTFEGNGLTNISSRAKELGAELYWNSRPDHGTRISVVFNI